MLVWIKLNGATTVKPQWTRWHIYIISKFYKSCLFCFLLSALLQHIYWVAKFSRVFPYCTVKSFDVWLKMYKCPDRFFKTLWLERSDIPHFTWSLINKECTCLFDISKEYTSSDLLRACFWMSPYSFRKISDRPTSKTLMARLLTVNSSHWKMLIKNQKHQQ